MSVSIYIKLILLSSVLLGCNRNIKQVYSGKNVQNIQAECENVINSWIKDNATFPDSYISLQFEKVIISTLYQGATEIVPLRKYSLEHTFTIRNNEGKPTYASLVFELTPDFFVQKIRYKQKGELSLATRNFPPEYQIWTEQYGRTYTAKDSMNWNEHNRFLIAKLSEKFLFNRYIDPQGEDKTISDSLVKELNTVFISK